VQNYHLSPAGREAFRRYIGARRSLPHFANARSIRNALDRMRLRHANRHFGASGLVSFDDLSTIEPEDILGSRVFTESEAKAEDRG
jgi:hypothetical protein